jgi:drug/metabolite transporter (DMT)-like permease
MGLMLAISSAALINLGFLLQQRGLVRGIGDGVRAWLGALRSRSWLGGQALGWLGFALQILAVGLAPLSLVQAFAAGGLALSVPLAAGIFGHRVPRLQIAAVMAATIGLVVLSLGVSRPGTGMSTASVMGITALVLAGATAINSSGGAPARAVSAGLFYGVGDAAIKAVAVGLRTHGASGLLSGWTVLAAAATLGGFLAFQAGLRRGNAVSAIALMTMVTTITALIFGLAAFHESLGSGPAITSLHLAGVALVLSCVPVLADANLRLPRTRRGALHAAQRALARALRSLSASTGVVVAGLIAVLAGTGLLYGLRGLGWLTAGPRLHDALPLLQLAGTDGQPLVRVAAAWLLAGVVLGLGLIRIKPPARTVIVAGLGLVLLLFASEASFAVARNLRLSSVLTDRVPGIGPWVEGLLLAAGATLPRPVRRPLPLPREALEPVVSARRALSGTAN